MSTLSEVLAAVLPSGTSFYAYHLSTPPTRTEALCSAPPGQKPDRTFVENHFLALGIDVSPGMTVTQPSPRRVLVLGIEVFVYTTAFTTILFVSKADSTGYLNSSSSFTRTEGSIDSKHPSPIREVCRAFVAFLLSSRHRPGKLSVVSLFARAQSQYLFPGSVENPMKHVLDDRGLVRWWCRVLDPLIQSPPSLARGDPWSSTKGYLIVPGQDARETRAFLPREPHSSDAWVVGHPLDLISHYCREHAWVPPRCLIMRFPDDPTSRFRDELDEEANRSTQARSTGRWKSVSTVDQFWDMMTFRQECSSGRLTGFIWLVFDSSGSFGNSDSPPPPPRLIRNMNEFPQQSMPSEKVRRRKDAKPKLSGPIRPRQPQVKTGQRDRRYRRPIETAYYYWPDQGRGSKIVDEHDYKRAVELLLQLNFSNFDIAARSTERWVDEVGADWCVNVVGLRKLPAGPETLRNAPVRQPVIHNLSALVKRKRPVTAGMGDQRQFEKAIAAVAGHVTTAQNGSKMAERVNILGPSIVPESANT